jgi:hypothetical protein
MEVLNLSHKLMTDEEIGDVIMESHRLREAGRMEEATALHRTIPVPAYLAKLFKEKVGAEFLINGGWNLAEAEAEFGSDWLDRQNI